MRNGPPYPRADNFGGYNMAPPHSVPNPHNHGPLPMGASARPPSKMFGPPDFPGISSADAYRQHHEVTAMVRSLTAWLYYVKKKLKHISNFKCSPKASHCTNENGRQKYVFHMWFKCI